MHGKVKGIEQVFANKKYIGCYLLIDGDLVTALNIQHGDKCFVRTKGRAVMIKPHPSGDRTFRKNGRKRTVFIPLHFDLSSSPECDAYVHKGKIFFKFDKSIKLKDKRVGKYKPSFKTKKYKNISKVVRSRGLPATQGTVRVSEYERKKYNRFTFAADVLRDSGIKQGDYVNISIRKNNEILVEKDAGGAWKISKEGRQGRLCLPRIFRIATSQRVAAYTKKHKIAFKMPDGASLV